MNPSTNPSYTADSLGSPVSAFSLLPKAAASHSEDFFGFSTTDGRMVTFNAGQHAISKGAGIFIGEYFVGLVDSYFADAAMPCIKY
jgi:hypothetical protein